MRLSLTPVRPRYTMAYALIAWQVPPGLDSQQVEIDVLAALPGTTAVVRFFDNLLLYPSAAVGIGFSTVRTRMTSLMKMHPGLEVLVIMPEPGDTVAGWLDPARGVFDAARPIMNRSDATTYPLLLPLP